MCGRALAGLLLAVLTLAACGADRAIAVFGSSGDEPGLRQFRELQSSLVSVLPHFGFAAKSVVVLSESRPYDKTELKQKFETLAAGPDDRVWLFLFGHVQQGRGDLFFKLPRGVISGRELASAIDSLGGRQMVFCFSALGYEIQEQLKKPGRITLSALAGPGSRNLPRFPAFFLKELALPGEGWLEPVREAALAVQQSGRAAGIYLDESPRLTVGERDFRYPFSDVEESLLPPRSGVKAAVRRPVAPAAGRFPEGAELFSPRSEREVIWAADGGITELTRQELVILSPAMAEAFTVFAPPRPAGTVEFHVSDFRHVLPDGAEGKIRYDENSGVLRLADLAPGSRIEYAASARTLPVRELPAGFTACWPLGANYPKENVKFTLTLPKKFEPRFRFDALAQAPDIEVTETAYSNSYRIELPELRAVETIPFLPDDERLVPAIRMSLCGSWEAFVEEYRKLLEGTEEAGPAAEELARKLAEGEKEPEAILRKLYGFVNSMRYDTTPIGIRALRPRLPDQVVESGYGDCKDKANALVAMAKVHGIEGFPVLVNRGEVTDPEFPGWQFNHMAAFFPGVSGGLFLDATDPDTPFGSLPPGDFNRQGLVIRPGKAEFVRLRPMRDSENRLELSLRFAPGKPTEFRLESSGLFLYRQKQLGKRPKEARRYLMQSMLDGVVPGAGLLALDDRDAAKISGTLEPSFRVTLPEFLRAPFAMPGRRQPVMLCDGQKFTFVLRLEGVRYRPFESAAGPVSCKTENSGSASILTLTFLSGKISASDYDAVRKLLKGINHE